jgi:hypothetical protein
MVMKKTVLYILALFVICSMAAPALAGGYPEEGLPERSGALEALTICTEPRPQICTMDYQPVCAKLEDGTFKTYSNGCTACADTVVIGHREGVCK